MNDNKSMLVKDSHDNIEPDMLEEYEGLDVEDDIYYHYESKTYYGARSMYVDVDDYDFDNYGYDD